MAPRVQALLNIFIFEIDLCIREGQFRNIKFCYVAKVELPELVRNSAQKREMISMGRLFLLFIWSSHTYHWVLTHGKT